MSRGDLFGPPEELTETQRREREREVLGRVAERLGSLRLTAPAIFFLESIKPLSFVSSQALVFLGPTVQALFPWRDYQLLAEALESRENLEWLIRRLEEIEEGEPPAPPDDAT